MISTKGRYALRVMADIASNDNGEYITVKEIAARQDISKKYLERIMNSLSSAGLITVMAGRKGGYRLNRTPQEYSLLEILEAAEGDLGIVRCLKKNAEPCSKTDTCPTLPLWKEYNEMTRSFFRDKSLSFLLESPSQTDITAGMGSFARMGIEDCFKNNSMPDDDDPDFRFDAEQS